MREIAIIIIALTGLAGCLASNQVGSSGSGSSATGIAAPLTQSEYNALSNEDKYMVMNNLTTTLFKGIDVADFFDLSKGLDNPQLLAGAPTIESIEGQLDEPMTSYTASIQSINNKYFYTESRMNNTRAYPLAVLYEFPFSKEYFTRWMAYRLTNNILFSPARELDSADDGDVQKVYNRLVQRLDEGMSIRDIIEEHVKTQENWRRFRSPEDNTREMMEIFLMRYKDEEVPLAAKACRNWYLTDDDMGYELRKTLDFNYEPQTLLDTNNIVSCDDFYHELATHAQLIPAVTTRLVNDFFPNFTTDQKSAFVSAIVNTNPTRFQDIFSAIIFSKEYLMNNKRTKSFEEAFFGVADRTDWYAGRDFFSNVTSTNGGADSPNLSQMKQETMTYKLGRSNSTPLDSLSFAYYHKALRNQLLLDRRTTSDPDNTQDGGWRETFIVNDDVDLLNNTDFVNYLFLSVLSRRPTSSEMSSLLQTFEDNGYEDNKLARTMITFDYFSRLPELYAFSAIN